ncbi:MAG: enoyl-CoA hydratase/isomerase family protein [Planctomycetales bacterium]|nr:enoyl-CoA hydratase/isomerase family protein [Planctomycetales bacterium]
MPQPATITLSQPEPDIGVLTFDMPDKGANVLARVVLEELSAHLDELEKRKDLAGVVLISGKPGQFIAGADLREFAASLNIDASETIQTCRRGQDLFARLSQGPYLTVAAIDGICVGGGAELAAWCDRRVMTQNPKTQFGFPEVKLGLFPGWGGTVRAPRIVGLSNAIELITGGESIDAATAAAMGWASDITTADQLLAAAIGVIRAERETGEYLLDREKWSGPVDISETEQYFLGATASAVIQQQTKGHYPAPLAALETMMGSANVDAATACQMEAEGMANLFGSPINAALLNIFFLTDRNKKDRGVEQAGVASRDIKLVGVVGAGIMGAGIAAANVRRNHLVNLTDVNRASLAKGVQTVLDEVSYNRETKQKDLDHALEFAPLINATTADSEMAQCDLIIEAVVENAEIKRKVYERLEPLLSDHAILASNTSTIPIADLAAGLQNPDRFCGIHFFNPVRRMKLVEVIRGAQTSDHTVVTAVEYAKTIGKSPIVVNDGPGFLVNRLLNPYMNEALLLIQEGATLQQVDAAAKKFGMPMGPIALFDVVGLDTAMYAGTVLHDAFPDRVQPSRIVASLVDAGRLGQKTGSGFFSYQNKKKRAEPDRGVEQYLAPHRTAEKEFATRELIDRLFLPVVVEATRILEEHIVRDPRDIDLGMIFGTGFPPFRGGLMFWVDTEGVDAIVERLRPLEPLGKRFQPTELLLELAKRGGKFYDL